jgi:integrase/recombinase XerD
MLKKREKRTVLREEKEYPNYTFDEAISYVSSAKKAEGLRERTLRDYGRQWGYFIKWLTKNYEDIEFVSEITIDMMRNHINYMKYDVKKYDGHKYRLSSR